MTCFLLWYSSKIKYLGAVEGFLVLSKDGCFERNISEVSFSHMASDIFIFLYQKQLYLDQIYQESTFL